ncbi:MAG: hypothetical protein EWV49_13810 [Microcystis aeruginosa Ma_QC_Ch_20071001_S25]|jgi:hypothetical protein|uniref:Uncharacterized protein n=1 Tax=Microcystis aeruginosa Ma_QC_Ch_20071001_S25D TaxID=2486250 RepID=A0A552FG16_MICAE|nr:hypothetical protein [Microcystis sp. M113S1]MCA2939158.1 hypothetical protein [Microcystis sp. M113S1]TRU45666.1 MAG: hypothetical protein EWV57_20210 [Microcystis aeruginosa Ma_QC_Ch_20071001_S25D]TRU48107.1 MAG: hypothetical protein EWV49_13810 [Microcystis aeruginosa Ma_QC_Ch_20071001_S25]TRU61083.1 MAG: hypothetical protein EWV90_13370 [Microcystis aeruginosa Ma_QC_Ch_20071001_M135]
MQLSIDVFNDVVRYLDSHEEKLRIKKLIFCICKKYWENEPNILNGVAMEDLVKELVQLKTNKEQLTFSVYKLVKTLNRPQVYLGVATVIIEQISQLYSNIAAAYDNQLLPVEPEVNPSFTNVNNDVNNEEDNLLRQVVSGIENHRETARIQKLMFAACKNRWENDQAVINNYGLKNIVLELQRNNPNFLSLRQTLRQVAENINKKALYLALADIILTQLEHLYDTDNDDEEEDNESKSQRFNTQIVDLKNDSDSAAKTTSFSTSRSDPVDFSSSIINLNEPQLVMELPFAEPASSNNNPSNFPQIPAYDPFEIRLEIFQYANPLRAKILIFSLLFHPWDRSGQDWSTLRSYTLEDLLKQLIQSGKSLQDIEVQLYNIAQTQMDTDANVQTASILVQTLQKIL